MCSSCFFPLLASVTVNRDYLPVGLSSGKVSASSSCMLQKKPMWQNYENCLVFFTPSPLLRCLTCTSIYKSCQKALKKFMLRSTFFEIFPDVWPVLKSLQEWIFVGILLLSGHNSIFLHIVNTTKTTTVEGRVIYPLSNLLELAKRPR